MASTDTKKQARGDDMTDKEMTQKICRNVKYLCLIYGEKLGDVEKAIGVSPGYISRTHKDASDFSICKAKRLADYFTIPVSFLYEIDYCKMYHERELKRIESGVTHEHL